MPKKRLLILIPNLGPGGAQKVYRQQMKILSDNFEVYGCVFNRDGFLSQDDGAGLFSLDVPGGSNVVSKIFFFFLRIVRLRRLKKELAINVCISHLEGADYVNLLSSRMEKVICWIHGTKSFDQNISGWLGVLRKKIFIPFIYRRCHLLVAVNTRIKRELVSDFQIPEIKIEVIYNGFDLEGIQKEGRQPLEERFQMMPADHLIVTHCRLAKEKNLLALLEIFNQLRNSIPAQLWILGDGEVRDELVKRSREMNLLTFDVWSGSDLQGKRPDVCFFGYQSNPYPFLSKAAVYVMTSLWEGFPLSLCEAMACGIPVISSDCHNGPREILHPRDESSIPSTEILHGEFGILIPMVTPGHPSIKQCSEEIVKLLSDEERREFYRRKSIERVAEFDYRKITVRIVDAIERIAPQ